MRAPRFIVAVACGVASYAMMNMVMTSAPLAMVGCGHSVTDAALGIQWHVLAMYAPSFFTGSLIARFGVERITGIGLALIALTAVVGIAGITVAHFWSALVLLGLGWNFAFIGATTMVTQCHRAEERNKVQAFNDFLIFGSMAVASFSSGQLLADFGWAWTNAVIFPVIALAAALLAWLSFARREARGLRHPAWSAGSGGLAVACNRSSLDLIPNIAYSPKCPAQPRGVVARRSDDGAAGRGRCRRCGIAPSGAGAKAPRSMWRPRIGARKPDTREVPGPDRGAL